MLASMRDVGLCASLSLSPSLARSHLSLCLSYSLCFSFTRCLILYRIRNIILAHHHHQSLRIYTLRYGRFRVSICILPSSPRSIPFISSFAFTHRTLSYEYALLSPPRQSVHFQNSRITRISLYRVVEKI